MTQGLRIERDVCWRRKRQGRKVAREGAHPPTEAPAAIPRISRLMALAIRFDRLIRTGVVADQADLARFGYVTRARVTQIMNLLQLAPDIQEELLHLPITTKERDYIAERRVRPVVTIPDWRKQRKLWRKLVTDCHTHVDAAITFVNDES